MSEKQIRVVFVVTGLPVGGAELVLYRLLSNLPSWVKPHVVSLRQIDHVGRRIEELGITVDCLGMNQGRLNPFALLFALS